MEKRKTILFLANHFITLYAFRRELIERLALRGHRVVLSLPESEENAYFTGLGCEIIPTAMSRRGTNPLDDLRLLRQYCRILRDVKPDLVFSYTVKPNIYGSMASRALGCRQLCNITGTGASFLRDNALAKVLRVLYRLSVRGAYKVFFQNGSDRDYFVRHRMVGDNWEMLPGSGVNLEQHAFSPMPDDGELRFLYIGRMMAVKGVDQYLDCARAVHERYPNTRFYLAGFIDEERYRPLLEAASREGCAEYLGFRRDIDDWIRRCHCTLLPSLGGEGIPNVLLESAATGRICIASDIPGCRDVVDDGVTGFLFPAGDSAALIGRVERVIAMTPAERAAMGQRGREKVAREFDREIVIRRYMQEVEA